ncbi:armadillo-type protein [Pseudomassariella vexata]|uniref:Armadillo-type protein n=1 Tax=Pseudomassariella vexata TaxID=1141098 RepID=A0A1Y2DLQ2_9PEZI|nr:armadillo-type protein [Pseudomassariella vexata]ORY60141.1 armadillo-type protein [Pseudomassariella vexata]
MTPRDAVSGNKRKSADYNKGKTSKKPKFEKRPLPPPVESEDVSDAASFEDFSDDQDDGGALLRKHKFQKNGKPNSDDKTADGKVFERGQNSRESHIKQKQLALERRNHKPLADESHRTKKIWERLRRKSHVPKEERDKLVEELFTIITGRIKEFALKHDTVRVVQTAIKYSTVERRKMIARELQGSYPQLAESKYAKFLIGKLIVGGDKEKDSEIRDLIVPEFYGKVRKLINHPEASWIMDDIYRGIASKEQKAILLREWYGPEFAIFRTEGEGFPTAELSKILGEEPSKRAIIMRYLSDMTNQLIQKKMTGFTMLHDAMLQYFLNTQPGSEEAKAYAEMIKEDEGGDLLKNMAFTNSGAHLVSLLLAYGSAKDRKMILKTYKDTFQLMSTDPNAHIIILTAYDVIDDTVLTSKSIFPELLGKNEENEVNNLVVLSNDPHARLTIRYLFEGASKSLFDLAHTSDLNILGDIWEIRKTTSKKDPEIRRKELVAALSPTILSAIESAPTDLISTSFGCQMVGQALLSAVGDKAAALAAIASTAAGDPALSGDVMEPAEGAWEADAEKPVVHISRTAHGGRMFKTLIAGGHFDKAAGQIKPVGPPLNFANILYPVLKDHVVSWATGPSSFVVLGLLEAEDFSHADELKKILKKDKKLLEKAATEETAEQKAQREAAETNGEAEKPAKKGKKAALKKNKPVGNFGSKLVLEKLKK